MIIKRVLLKVLLCVVFAFVGWLAVMAPVLAATNTTPVGAGVTHTVLPKDKTDEAIDLAKARLARLFPASPDKARSSHVFVFISFSMPKGSLRQWLYQAQKIKAPLVLRGLVDHSLAATTREVADLLGEKKTGGVALDPPLFKRFGITQVPAVVVTRADASFSSLDGATPPFDVVYGDVPLKTALAYLATHGAHAKEQAQQALTAWEASDA